MADELIDVLDENMVPIGTATRSEAHRLGLWHLALHCWVVRAEAPGHVLFQRRASGVSMLPGLLDVTAAGHCASGEPVEEGVVETLAQLGPGHVGSSPLELGTRIELARIGNDLAIHEFCRTYLQQTTRRPHEYELDHDVTEGLVEVAVPDGLALFSGEVSRVTARGIEYDVEGAAWRSVEIEVGRTHFFPRIDPYYSKVFIMSERLLKGERHLAI